MVVFLVVIIWDLEISYLSDGWVLGCYFFCDFMFRDCVYCLWLLLCVYCCMWFFWNLRLGYILWMIFWICVLVLVCFLFLILVVWFWDCYINFLVLEFWFLMDLNCIWKCLIGFDNFIIVWDYFLFFRFIYCLIL